VSYDPKYYNPNYFNTPDPFDINSFKITLRDTLRTYLYPQCQYGTVDVNIPPSYKIAQSFIPFSQFYQKVVPYRYTISIDVKVKRIGTIDSGLAINIRSDSNNIPSTTALSGVVGNTIPANSISPSYSTITTKLILKPNKYNDLPIGSKSKYWLELSPLNSTGTIVVARHTEDKYLPGIVKVYDGTSWSQYQGDMYFKLGVKNWIYTNYPREDLSLYNYPRIAIDIIDVPRVEQRYIYSGIMYYYITSAVIIYSRYPDELETIASYVDRALFKERTSLSNIILLTPTRKTNVIPVREKLFSKSLFYELKYQMTNI